MIIFNPDDEASMFLADNYIQWEDEAEELLQEVLAAKPVGGKSIYFYNGEAYEVDQNFNPPIVKEIKGSGSKEE